MVFVLLTWPHREQRIRDHEEVPMNDWLTILNAAGGVLSAAAAATLINTVVRVRRGRRHKPESTEIDDAETGPS
jgi:hypothetical protein